MINEDNEKYGIFIGYFKSKSTNYYCLMGSMYYTQAMNILKSRAPDDSYDFRIEEIDEETFDKFTELHDVILELASHEPLYTSSIFDEMKKQIKRLRNELGVKNYKDYAEDN